MSQPSETELRDLEHEAFAPLEEPKPNGVMGPAGSVHEAINLVMSEVGYAQKTGKNAFHKYSYASEADVINALRPHLVKHDLMVYPHSQNISQDEHGNTHVQVLWTIHHHPSRTWIHVWSAGSGNDRAKNGVVGDKGIYKALTGATKYMLMKTFLLATGDDAEEAHETDSKPEIAPIKVNWTEWYDTVSGSIAACGTMDELREIVAENKPKYGALLRSTDKKEKQMAVDYHSLVTARKEQLEEDD